MRVLTGAYSMLAHGVPPSAFERVVDVAIKPLLTLLHHRRDVTLQLSLPMSVIEYLDTAHMPLSLLLTDLCRSGKVELLGGSYHQPILSLIGPKDRSNQIEMMTTALRKRFGQRPKNYFCHAQIFHPAYINTLNLCCMETVVTSVEGGSGGGSGYQEEPYLMQEMGKSVTIIPTNDVVNIAVRDYSSHALSFSSLLRLIKELQQTRPDFFMAMVNIDQLVRGGIKGEETAELFSMLLDYGCDPIEEILSLEELPKKGYLPSGWYGYDAKRGSLYTINDLFVRDESMAYLYGRYTSMVEHARLYKKDKDVRRRLESLIQKASAATPYLHDAHASMIRPSVRTLVWRVISEVDSILSSLEDHAYVQTADYDRDECDEQLVISKNLSCVIDSKGGSLDELTYLPSLHNYGDAFAPLAELAVSQSSLHPPHSGEKRRLFTDVILKEGTSIEEYDKRDAHSCLDLGRRRYRVDVLDRKATEFRATVSVSDSPILNGCLEISKHYKVRQNTVFVEITLTNLADDALNFTYGCEVPISLCAKALPISCMLLDGKKGSVVQEAEMVHRAVKTIKVHDEPNSTMLSLVCDSRFTLLKEDYTIDERTTVGDETIYLHTLFMPCWPLSLEGGEQRKITLGLRVERK